MWMGGSPAGHCGKPAYGEQYPREVLAERNARYLFDQPAYCFGPCCPAHGGPEADEPRIYRDGYTEHGRPMWCAVMPDFVNLQESPAGFSGDGRIALRNLRAALVGEG
jgi:hypothetical protein